MRIIIPPLTSQYPQPHQELLAGVAIGYPDFVSVFTGTVLNQTGQAVEVILITMGVFLTLSLLTSLFMNWFNTPHGAGGAVERAMAATAEITAPAVRPPRSVVGPMAWLRANLFSSLGQHAS